MRIVFFTLVKWQPFFFLWLDFLCDSCITKFDLELAILNFAENVWHSVQILFNLVFTCIWNLSFWEIIFPDKFWIFRQTIKSKNTKNKRFFWKFSKLISHINFPVRILFHKQMRLEIKNERKIDSFFFGHVDNSNKSHLKTNDGFEWKQNQNFKRNEKSWHVWHLHQRHRWKVYPVWVAVGKIIVRCHQQRDRESKRNSK